jgi:ArsR family transcriptional regulator
MRMAFSRCYRSKIIKKRTGTGRYDSPAPVLWRGVESINLHPSMNALTRHIVRIGKALSEPARIRLLEELARRGRMYCTEVQQLLQLAQPTVSHHLKVLSDAGLILTHRRGRHLELELNPANVALLQQWLQALVGPTQPQP